MPDNDRWARTEAIFYIFKTVMGIRKVSEYNKNRGSCMSVHVLLNLLNELGKRDRMQVLPSILFLFHNELNKFNTRALILDSIYHMTLILL